MSIDLPERSRYVAMGSSFAAGPGLRPSAAGSPRRAGRSAVNAAHLLSARRGLDLVDVSYSGATTADFLGPSATGVPAQLDAVDRSTRLITITGGGNDIGYLGLLTVASAPGILRRLPASRRSLDTWSDRSTLDNRFGGMRSNMLALIGRISERAPDAAIVLIDYLTILPPDDAGWDGSSSSGRPDAATADLAREIARRLTTTFRSIAAETGGHLVESAELSRTHHAWADAPWTRGFGILPGDGVAYHPRAVGMRAVATALDALLVGST